MIGDKVSNERPRFARCGCPFIPCNNPWADPGGWCQHSLDVAHNKGCQLKKIVKREVGSAK